MFGIIDLVPEHKKPVIEKELDRLFTVMATQYSEVLCLALEVSEGILMC